MYRIAMIVLVFIVAIQPFDCNTNKRLFNFISFEIGHKLRK